MGFFDSLFGKKKDISSIMAEKPVTNAPTKKPKCPDEIIEKSFNDCNWFHYSGITPALSLISQNNCRIANTIAQKKGLTISVDLLLNTIYPFLMLLLITLLLNFKRIL